MIVYMLLNTVTEKIYIGATKGTLLDRWAAHLKAASAGSECQLHHAIRSWPSEFWEVVVICNCYSEQEMSDAEQAWQRRCDALNPSVGYNESRISYSIAQKHGGDPLTAVTKPGSPLSGLTIEERREYFRAAGRRGAAKSKAISKSS